MLRLFYALWPAPDVRERLELAASALAIHEGRAVRAENLHLTLLFLGQVEDDLCSALCAEPMPVAAPPFTLEIAATGWWRTSRVAWLAPLDCPDPLTALVSGLQATARAHSIAFETAHFRPHVTVARDVRRAPRATGSIAVQWPVNEYALVSSTAGSAGSSYSLLARWPLPT